MRGTRRRTHKRGSNEAAATKHTARCWSVAKASSSEGELVSELARERSGAEGRGGDEGKQRRKLCCFLFRKRGNECGEKGGGAHFFWPLSFARPGAAIHLLARSARSLGRSLVPSLRTHTHNARTHAHRCRRRRCWRCRRRGSPAASPPAPPLASSGRPPTARTGAAPARGSHSWRRFCLAEPLPPPSLRRGAVRSATAG